MAAHATLQPLHAHPRTHRLQQRCAAPAPAAASLARARRCRHRPAVRTAAVAGESAAPAAPLQSPGDKRSDVVVAELIEFLKEDLTHLFDDQGIDDSKYDKNVDFQDPITKHTSLAGYLLNIQFLRRVFDPTFILHDLRRTGEWEITTRWTMTMTPLGLGGSSRSGGPPRLVFTGTSVMGINPQTEKFNRHYDTWDAVQQQQFFSAEAFGHLMTQVFDLRKTPAIETPAYSILKKTADYEVRRYEPFLVAETGMVPAGAGTGAAAAAQGSPGSGGGGGSGGGVGAFRALAGYIFGGNEGREKMAMTTPVFTSGARDRMQFVLPLRFQDTAALPAPLPGSGVETRQVEGGVFVARGFSGVARQEAAAEQAAALRRALERDGLAASAAPGYLLAQYNDPGTAPPFRRNEVLVRLDEFQLW